jgi:hypothetical protein
MLPDKSRFTEFTSFELACADEKKCDNCLLWQCQKEAGTLPCGTVNPKRASTGRSVPILNS